MKLFERCSSKNLFLKIVLGLLMLFALIGCSGERETDQERTNPSETELKIDQLQSDNEKLHTELEKAVTDVKEIETRIQELESKLEALEALEEAQVIPAPTEVIPEPVNITPPERSSSELLIGEWFYPKFFEQTLVNNWTQSLVFHANGTGKIIRTFYLPKDIGDYSTSDSLEEVSLAFSWSLEGDALHTAYDDGSNGFVDYIFLPEQQQLIVRNENGHSISDETHIYKRERTPIPEEYVEADVIFKNIQAQNASRTRKFLGTWYWDVMVWTFNEDGTGTLDIPKLGNHPAEIREFSYQVLDASADLTSACLEIVWDESTTSYYYPTFNADGSMLLANLEEIEVKLTRTFDIDNCPVSEEIVSSAMGVWTGSIFTDFLPLS